MIFLNILESHPLAFYICVGLIGLIVGSFLNVVIYRLPKMMEKAWRHECCEFLEIKNEQESEDDIPFNLIKPGSSCPHCNARINPWKNIPVLSYVFLRGKCSSCKNPISIRYPLVELLSSFMAIIVAYRFGYGIHAVVAILLTWGLIALSFIDFDCKLLPDDITLPLLWLGLICNLFGLFTDIYSSLIGAILGYLTLWFVYHLFKVITGKEGMGYGDFKLLAMLGAWMGWQLLPLVIVLSSFSGAIIGISLIMFRSHDKSVPIPFGPYLALAGWISLLWGHQLIAAYYNWLSW